MYVNNFDIYSYNKDAYKNLQEVHEEIGKKEFTNETPEELTKLYIKEMNRSLFLTEPNITKYGRYQPY